MSRRVPVQAVPPPRADRATKQACGLLLLLLGAFLAGCTDNAPADEPATMTTPSPLRELAASLDLNVDASIADPTRDPSVLSAPDRWYLLDLGNGTGPQAQAFRFSIDAAFLTDQSDDVWILEFTPSTADGAPLDLGILVFVETANATMPLALHTARDHTYVEHGLTERTTESRAPSTKPFAVALFYSLLSPGDTIHVVVGTERATSRQAALTMRVDPDGVSTPILDLPRHRDDHLGALRANGTGIPVLPSATAAGWAAAAYHEFAGPDGHTETYDDAFQVDEALPLDPRPLVTARSVTIGFDHAVDQGWGVYLGGYLGPEASGEWSFAGDLHGQTIERNGRFVGGGSVPAVGPPPFIEAFAGGDGGLETEMVLTFLDTGRARITLILSFDVAVPIRDLLGTEVQAAAEAPGTERTGAADPAVWPRTVSAVGAHWVDLGDGWRPVA